MPIASAKVTSKGQITLPAKLREQLGIKPGDRLDFEQGPDGKVELVARTKTFAGLKGILKYDGPPLSDDDIVELVRQARSGRADHLLRQVSKSGT